MSGLADRECKPCRGNTPPLKGAELENLRRQVTGWEVVEGHHLRREFRFENFREALKFVNQVAEIAEDQGHHPNVSFTWGWVELEIFTHAVDGLTENDFVLAAKVDRI